LGVKRENKGSVRNVDIEKDMTLTRSTPERVERIINQMLADILNDYFSNPY
jgi:hypothetical protein